MSVAPSYVSNLLCGLLRSLHTHTLKAGSFIQRGKGLADDLVKTVEAFARSKGKSHLELTTLKQMPRCVAYASLMEAAGRKLTQSAGRACRLYERNGFNAEMVVQFGPEAAKKEGIPTDEIFDIVFFVKSLSASKEHTHAPAEGAAVADGRQPQAADQDKRSAALR